MKNDRIRSLVEAMTLDEKLLLMHGELRDGYNANQAGHVNGIARLGIPDVFICDGEYGVNVLWDATALPAKVALAATFDTDSARRYGSVLGRESQEAGMHVVLSSRVNIARDPVAQIGQSNGGNFQTLSEDPLLNGRMGRAEVEGIEKDHQAIANLKHFFGSSTGTAQGAENSQIDEQAMHDVYLWPFEMVIRAGVGSMMTSYNQVNGCWTYRHTDLIENTLRRTWGFTGFIVCDWCCLYSSLAARGGVTLEMPEDVYYGQRLKEAVLDPTVDITEADVDRCVTLYLSTLERFGMLDAPRVPAPVSENVKRQHIPIARSLSTRSAVLLKNEGVLPLDAARTTLAVIGPTGAAVAMPVFKEGASGFSDRKQSPWTALQELTGREIPFAQGTDMEGEVIPASAWTSLHYYRTSYETDPMNDRDLRELPTAVPETDAVAAKVDFQGENGLPPISRPDEYYMFHGRLTAEETGWHRLSLQTRIPTVEDHDRHGITNEDMFCFTSGNLYIHQDGLYRCIGIGTRTAMNGGVVANSDMVPCADGWNNAAGFLWMEAGQTYDIAATATNLYREPVEVRLCWSKPGRRKQLREEAAALAASVDVPVVFAWHKSPSDTLELKEEQNELIRAVAEANPNTVVVLNSGDPVAMPWLDNVAAVLEMWYPGQEGGYATADVLLGRCDPGGRLPVTFPVRVEDTASHDPEHPERCAPCGKVSDDGHVAENVAAFTEGVDVGYRWFARTGVKPLFPFGHGLSYTQFALEALSVADTPEGGAVLTCRVSNVGERDGVCVVQGYLGAPEKIPEGVQVPVKALAAFASVEVAAGQHCDVTMTIEPESFCYWSIRDQRRVRLEGERPLWIGFSSEDLPITLIV